MPDKLQEIKRRLKLAAAMFIGTFIALIRPREIQQVLYDHLEAGSQRRNELLRELLWPDMKEELALEAENSQRKTTDASDEPDEHAVKNARRLSIEEIEKVTLTANIEKRKQVETSPDSGEPPPEISTDDARLIIKAYLAFLSTRQNN